MRLVCSFFFFLIYSCTTAFAQQQSYVDAKELTLIGKAQPIPSFYHRVDTARYSGMPLAVKKLFTNAAGLAIVFKTNSPVISAKWQTTDTAAPSNMTAIASMGLDLYIKRDGKWVFAGVGRPKGNNTVANLVSNMDGTEKECLLYLPLYDEVLNLQIGVAPGSHIEPLQNPFKGKIVIYGSSILQGASASRPGMAYPARLSRKYGLNFINLGVSGNGKMEKEVADMVADIDGDAFVLDCAPNPSPEQITERTAYLVKTIRQKHPQAPIVMIPSVVREGGNFDLKIKERVANQNKNFKTEYEKLKAQGIKDLYFIEGNLLGTDHEASVDGIHPNDLGFDRMLQVIEPPLMKILSKVKGL
ncbi:hydrolase [Chitinophaga agrisoli]|uniref:Hydrolase n=1 Tax=Chitinophaga agrisoli TaxID=2607653 RepID=A0A5B2VNT6_9BACT|nr:SGNH/GDSL hydrolase family protein [Chitinophaga agrisoli]KAA2240046.1 hydrolase [Chitinophaga agrisoli]